MPQIEMLSWCAAQVNIKSSWGVRQ